MTLLGIAEGVPSSYIGDACTMEDAETDLGRSNDTSIQRRFGLCPVGQLPGTIASVQGTNLPIMQSSWRHRYARIGGGPMHAQLSACGSYCSHTQ